MRVLVTGATGLIGSGIVACLAKDHDVVGLDRNAAPGLDIVADCNDVAEWRHLVGAVDAIVHTAALHAPHVGRLSDQLFRRTNVEATSRLLDWALGTAAKSFVLTSTTSLYGHALEPRGTAVWVDENLEPSPRDIYDETKLAAEQLLATAGDSITVTSLRMSRCFPEPADVMAWYRFYRGVDRRDVAAVHALAVRRSGPPATYVISARTPFEVADCEDLFTDAPAVIECRCPGLIKRMAAKGWLPPRSIGRVYDCSLAIRELGYSPRFGMDSCLAANWDPHPSR